MNTIVEEIIDMKNNKDNYSARRTKNINNNVKRILCSNIVTKKYCSFGKKCLYAHTLEDQIIDNDRIEAYDILRNDANLEHINLVKNTSLYNVLDTFTKLCTHCLNNSCPGGYNCHRGACDKRFQICSDDMKNGDCRKYNCSLIHLTKRGLVPYREQIKRCEKTYTKKFHGCNSTESKSTNTINKSVPVKSQTIWDNTPISLYKQGPEPIIGNSQNTQNTLQDETVYKNKTVLNNESIFIKHTKKKDLHSKNINKNELEGILLTDKFFKSKLITDNDTDISTSDDFETCDDIKKTISYLNSETNVDSEDESIFIE